MPDSETGVAARLDADLKDAMRAGDAVRRDAIRRARSALKNAEIEARGPLSDDAAVKVLRGIVKQHKESIEQFTAGGRDDLVAQERREMEVVDAYLPAQMDAAAIEAVVTEVIAAEGAAGPGDMGRVMKAVMSRVGGQADGKEVRVIVQRVLGGDR
ncbi:MAG: GatB/YqeY domain-containing protein [Thermoleophilia bacterium]